MFIKLNGKAPKAKSDSYVSEAATLVGDITIGHKVTIWSGAMLRADLAKIVLGELTNVQDGAVIHVTHSYNTIVGEKVTIGHGAIVHACEVGDNCLIGMNSVIMDGAKIGKNTIIGAMTMVPHFREYPDGVLIMGSPARVIRPLTQKEINDITQYAIRNYENSRDYYLNGKVEIIEKSEIYK